jgi:hypothetical protein
MLSVAAKAFSTVEGEQYALRLPLGRSLIERVKRQYFEIRTE